MTKEDILKIDDDRRRRNRWITDALYMKHNALIIYANSTRSITIYDGSGLNHMPLWLIIGFPNIIECMTYSDQKSKSQNTILYLGCDNGKKVEIIFKKKHDLFPRKQTDRLSVLYWQEVENNSEFLRFKRSNHGHDNNVKYIEYFQDQHKLISCSKDVKKSVLIDYTTSQNHSYVFKMHSGTYCFAYSSNLNLLITGSEDGFVRIWNPVVTKKPVLAIPSHRHGIVDIAIFSVSGFFITISRDAELRLWEIKEFQCVQVIRINFPSFHERQSIEWGIKCLFPGPKRQIKKELSSRNLANNQWFLNDDDIEVAVSGNDNKINLYQDEWERSNILVTCCNNVCKITLNFYDNKNRNFSDTPALPMQPLLNNVLIPNDWILNDSEYSSRNIVRNGTENNIELQRKVEDHMKELKFVLDRDLTEFITKNHDMNFKLVQLEEQKRKMQFYVQNGAPFLALDLYKLQELQIPNNLPSNNPRLEKLVEQTKSILSNAKARSNIFTDRSSSTKSPKSSRSSFMELN